MLNNGADQQLVTSSMVCYKFECLEATNIGLPKEVS